MPDETRPPAGWAAIGLRMLAVCGYGLWMLLGLGLALGIYSEGRGESLVPLLVGASFVSLGPLLASAGVPWLRGWRGWRLEPGLRPSRQALLALACYLPMLGVAGLARGSNDFWATRLVSAALAACSLACLVYVPRGARARRPPGLVAQLPVDRVITACYGGGLWLLLCVVSQDPAVRAGDTRMWVIGLLLLALLLGLVEGMRWQSATGPGRGAGGRWRRRFAAAALTYAVPCLGLLLVHYENDDRWLVLLAALACVVGRSIELHLYEGMPGCGGEAASSPG
jgi:hypothetical protein